MKAISRHKTFVKDLRDAELDLSATQICRSTKQNLYAKTAKNYLQKAKNRIEEIGQWGLMRMIERDFPQEMSQ